MKARPGSRRRSPGQRSNSTPTAVICLAGAELAATLDGAPVPYWQPFPDQGRTGVEDRRREGSGRARVHRRSRRHRRTVLSRQQIDVHARQVRRPRRPRADDWRCASHRQDDRRLGACQCSRRNSTPRLTHTWEIGVLYGPHGAPDFFAPEYIETFFASDWEVHYNSNPTGIRLIGPKPVWARDDGGEAGLASEQYSRQCLRHRHDRLHRGHAGHPRPRRPVARRLRLSGDDRAGRTVEDGTASARRQSPLQAAYA